MNQEKSRIFLQIAVIFFFLLVFFLFVSRNRANRPVLPGNEPERKEIALRKTPVVLAIEKAMPSVVNLSTSKIVDRHYSPWQQKISSRFAMPSERRQDQGYSIGSGSIIDQAGLIVTSAHVVSRAAQIEVTLNNGITFKGRTLAEDIENDVALLQILAPKRDFKTIQGIHPGDMMLVHGAWKSIESLAHKRREWLVVGRPLETAEHVTFDHKAPLAAVIMALMVFFMVFDVLPVAPVGIVIIAALLMVLTGCMRSVDAAYKSIGWESIVLIAAMMPMSTALEKTGVSAQVSEAIVTGLGTYGPLAALAGVYAATSLLSTFISNSATAILVAPIAMQTAAQMGVDPAPFLMTAAVAASACFAAPISTPPNAMVMSAGRYTFMDYVKVGVPLQIAIGVVAIFAIPLLFPF